MPAITEPAQFTATKQSGTARKFIVSITDGTDTWLFGNFDAEWTDGHVYHLCDKFKIRSGVDLFEDTWARSIVSLTIKNIPFKRGDDNKWLRLSDVVGDISAEAAKIYVTADPNTTQLSDCLQIFDGITRRIDGYDTATIRITLEDKGYLLDKVVLSKSIKDVT